MQIQSHTYVVQGISIFIELEVNPKIHLGSALS